MLKKSMRKLVSGVLAMAMAFTGIASMTVGATGEVPAIADNLTTFSAGDFSVSLDNIGAIRGLTDTKGGVNYSDGEKLSSLIALHLDKKVVLPTGMTNDNGTLTFTFDEGVTAKVKAQPKAKYIDFELVDLQNNSGKDLEYFYWGPISVDIKKTVADTLGVVYNDSFAVGLMGLNVKTTASWPKDVAEVYPVDGWAPLRFPNWYSAAVPTANGGALRAFTADFSKDRTKSFDGYQKFDVPALDPAICGKDGEIVGSKIALYGCAPSEVLGLVGEMEVAENLPHPTANGKWQKDPENLHTFQKGTEYLYSEFKTKDLQSRVEDARRLGATLMYGHDTFMTYNGDYRFKGFDTFEDFKTQISDVAKENDLMVGTKNRPGFIELNTPSAKGIDNIVKNVVRPRTTKITSAVSKTGMDKITVEDNTDFNGAQFLLIGEKEVVRATTSNGVCTITQRGAQETTPVEHAIGEEISILSYSAGWNIFRGNQQYINETMKTLADTINVAGMSLSDMDGLEESELTGHNLYMHNKTMDLWYNYLDSKDNVKAYSSGMTQWGWHIYTAQTWGEKYEDVFGKGEYDYRFGKNYDYFARNFFTTTMGLCGIPASTTVEQANFLGSKNAAFNTQMLLADNGGQDINNGISQSPIKNKLFDTFREWTTARDVNAFTMVQRMKMAPYNSHWDLKVVEPGIEWELKQLKKDGSSWVTDTTETAKAPGVTNLIHNAGVSVSSSSALLDPEYITDKKLDDFSVLGSGKQYVQIDLGLKQDVDQIRIWHDFEKTTIYKDVVVQLSNDPTFATDVTTVFNNDNDNSSGLGIGTDKEYCEPYAGKTIEFDTVNAQYVRIYSNGSNLRRSNRYAEIQVLNGKRSFAGYLPRENRNGIPEKIELINPTVSSNSHPEYVIDGDINTAWISGRNNEEWVAADVKDVDYALRSIIVRWGNQNAKKFTVKVLNDNDVWEDVCVSTTGTGATTIINLDKPIMARAIKVICSEKNDPIRPYAVAEIEAYTVKKSSTVGNIALGKPVSFSGSSEEGRPVGPEAVTNGEHEFDSGYFGIGTNGKQYVQIDLGQQYDIGKINLWRFYWNGGRTYYDTAIQISSDPTFQKDVTTVFNNDKDNSSGFGVGTDDEYLEVSAGKTVELATPVSGQYVRLWGNGNNKSGLGVGHHWSEVEVYGTEKLPPIGDPMPVDSDKAKLKSLIDYVKAQQLSDEYQYVVPAVKAALERELAKAQDIFDKNYSTQEQIDKAYSDLLAVVRMLSFIGNSDNLQVLYDIAMGIDTSLYTKGTAATLKDATDSAKLVLDNENAMQAEIDEALRVLQAAVDGMKLNIQRADLDKIIKKAQGYNLDEFLPVGQPEFKTALATAIVVNTNEVATDKEIADAYIALRNSMFLLREKPNKDKLNELINLIKELKSINRTLYTAESLANLDIVLDEVDEVVANPFSNNDDILFALERGKFAKSSLVPMENVKPDNETDNDTATEVKPVETETSPVANDVPATSDSNNSLLALLLALIGGACILARRKLVIRK